MTSQENHLFGKNIREKAFSNLVNFAVLLLKYLCGQRKFLLQLVKTKIYWSPQKNVHTKTLIKNTIPK